MKQIKEFLKKEVVLCIAWVVAIGSMFVVPPGKAYIDYIDIRTLALLFCLMAVVEGLQQIGFFNLLANSLLKNVKSTRQLLLILMLLSYFTAMFITNDVALITFVPFTIMILNQIDNQKMKIYAIALETVAANMGSMVTPIGNPQNLYLFIHYQLGLSEFLRIMAPVSIAALVLVLLCCLVYPSKHISVELPKTKTKLPKGRTILYGSLFLLALATVLRICPFYVTLGVILLEMLLFDRPLFRKIDYSLLMTFIAFFIFVGNMGTIDVIKQWLERSICGHEFLVSWGLSQGISNVPAALLISNFTDNYKELLIGVDLGGLGTLIASMASLISYKIYMKEQDSKAGKYILIFTIQNIIFFVILAGGYYVLG